MPYRNVFTKQTIYIYICKSQTFSLSSCFLYHITFFQSLKKKLHIDVSIIIFIRIPTLHQTLLYIQNTLRLPLQLYFVKIATISITFSKEYNI